MSKTQAHTTEADADDRIDLDVGGTLYTTSRATLVSQDSMLARMFSGRHEIQRRESDGRVFIGRDGELFRHVLDFLEGRLDANRLSEKTLSALKLEAAYFCLPGLEAEIDAAWDEIFSIVLSAEYNDEDTSLF